MGEGGWYGTVCGVVSRRRRREWGGRVLYGTGAECRSVATVTVWRVRHVLCVSLCVWAVIRVWSMMARARWTAM